MAANFRSFGRSREQNLRPPVRLPIGSRPISPAQRSSPMNGIIYLVGLIVVIMFILSFLGLR
jgi:hypothetical protein